MSKEQEDLIKQQIQKQLTQAYKDGWENCVNFIEKSLVGIIEQLRGYPSMGYFIHYMLPDIKKSVKELFDVEEENKEKDKLATKIDNAIGEKK